MYAKLRNYNVPQATIRVHFPDGFVVEATFKSAETISDIIALVRKSNYSTGFGILPMYAHLKVALRFSGKKEWSASISIGIAKLRF